LSPATLSALRFTVLEFRKGTVAKIEDARLAEKSFGRLLQKY